MKFNSTLAGSLLAVLPLLAPFHGQGQTLLVSERMANIAESGKCTHLVLVTPGRQYVFQPPPNGKLTVITNESRLTWVTSDFAASFNFRLWTNAAVRAEAKQSSGWPNSLRERFPEPRRTEEFPCYAQGGQGRGFDLHYVVGGKFKQATRLARFPVEEGIAEFEVTAPEEQFAQRQMELGRILNSFVMEAPPSR